MTVIWNDKTHKKPDISIWNIFWFTVEFIIIMKFNLSILKILAILICKHFHMLNQKLNVAQFYRDFVKVVIQQYNNELFIKAHHEFYLNWINTAQRSVLLHRLELKSHQMWLNLLIEKSINLTYSFHCWVWCKDIFKVSIYLIYFKLIQTRAEAVDCQDVKTQNIFRQYDVSCDFQNTTLQACMKELSRKRDIVMINSISINYIQF